MEISEMRAKRVVAIRQPLKKRTTELRRICSTLYVEQPVCKLILAVPSISKLVFPSTFIPNWSYKTNRKDNPKLITSTVHITYKKQNDFLYATTGARRAMPEYDKSRGLKFT